MDETVRYEPKNRLLIIVGNYGSGKTEVAVNLALHLAKSRSVRIVDLDIVNPYFRSREAGEEMEAAGITVIYPRGELRSADLPIVVPEVRGAIEADEGVTILDVGGDDAGARVLSSLRDSIVARPHDMLQVVNARRPFTADVAGCRRMRVSIEASANVAVTGVVSNTHLLEETDAAVVAEGISLARAFAEKDDITFHFAAATEDVVAELAAAGERGPFLVIERRLLPPWLTRGPSGGSWFRRGA